MMCLILKYRTDLQVLEFMLEYTIRAFSCNLRFNQAATSHYRALQHRIMGWLGLVLGNRFTNFLFFQVCVPDRAVHIGGNKLKSFWYNSLQSLIQLMPVALVSNPNFF